MRHWLILGLLVTPGALACGGPDDELGSAEDALRGADPGGGGGGDTVGDGSSPGPAPPAGCGSADLPNTFSAASATQLRPQTPFDFESCPQELGLTDVDWYKADGEPGCLDHYFSIIATDIPGVPTKSGLPANANCQGFGGELQVLSGQSDAVTSYTANPRKCMVQISASGTGPVFLAVSRSVTIGTPIHYRIQHEAIICHDHVDDTSPLPDDPTIPGFH